MFCGFVFTADANKSPQKRQKVSAANNDAEMIESKVDSSMDNVTQAERVQSFERWLEDSGVKRDKFTLKQSGLCSESHVPFL